MTRRDPLDRAIDFAFGVPIATTAFVREATRLALHSIGDRVVGERPTPSVDTDARDPRDPVSNDAVSTTDAPVTGIPVTGVLVEIPIEGYDSLSAREILVALDELDAIGLVAVESYEVAGRARRTILSRVAALRSATPQ